MGSPANAQQALLTDVLNLSRIGAGKLRIGQAPFNLHDTLNDVSAVCAEQVPTKPIDRALQIVPDRRRRGQRQRLLRLQVLGSDADISPRQQTTVVDAFTQADTSTTRRFGGNGLGLAICSSLIQRRGGGTVLQSELGQGCTFTVTLPLSEPAAADHGPLNASMEPNGVAQAAQPGCACWRPIPCRESVSILLDVNKLRRRLDGGEAPFGSMTVERGALLAKDWGWPRAHATGSCSSARCR